MVKKLKRLIILLVIIIIIILISIISIVIRIRYNNKDNEIIGDYGEVIDYSQVTTEKVTDKVKFYTVANCVSSYLNVLNKNNDKYFAVQDDGQRKKDIFDLLSIEYKEANNITPDNVLNYVYNIQQRYIFTPIDMNVLLAENVEKYVAYGIITDLDYEFVSEIYIIVNLDFVNKTFSIEQLKDNYSDINEIKIDNDNIKISKNDMNEYSDEKITNEYVSNAYFNGYKRLSISNPEIAYRYMQEEYRETRFGNIDDFVNYIEDNKNELKKLSMQQYLVNTYENYKEYVCKDQYNNLYIFKETTSLDYEITLDTYTLVSETFKTNYKKSDAQNKVMMNIDKWVQMINNRDYKTAYSVLDETFRKNNFGSVEKFEEYMREKYPEHYEMEFTDFTDKGEIYTQKLNLKSMEEGSTTTCVINMKLNSGLDFVMSFELDMN